MGRFGTGWWRKRQPDSPNKESCPQRCFFFSNKRFNTKGAERTVLNTKRCHLWIWTYNDTLCMYLLRSDDVLRQFGACSYVPAYAVAQRFTRNDCLSHIARWDIRHVLLENGDPSSISLTAKYCKHIATLWSTTLLPLPRYNPASLGYNLRFVDASWNHFVFKGRHKPKALEEYACNVTNSAGLDKSFEFTVLTPGCGSHCSWK